MVLGQVVGGRNLTHGLKEPHQRPDEELGVVLQALFGLHPGRGRQQGRLQVVPADAERAQVALVDGAALVRGLGGRLSGSGLAHGVGGVVAAAGNG